MSAAINLERPCSIVKLIDGRIVVVDHRYDDKIIEPSCGVDALAYFNFISSNLKFGATPAERRAPAMAFLVDIADGKMPVTNMIEPCRRGVAC